MAAAAYGTKVMFLIKRGACEQAEDKMKDLSSLGAITIPYKAA
jgi:hypothetical protein